MTETTLCIPKENKSTRVMFINKCKVTLNFLPESDDRAIETAKKILLATYYQNTSHKTEEIIAG